MLLRMILTGLVGAALLSAPVPAQTVRQATAELSERLQTVQGEVDGERIQDIIRDPLAELGALDDPPDRPVLVGLVAEALAARLDEGDEWAALEAMEATLPHFLPHLGPDGRQGWIDRYLAASHAELERDVYWIQESGTPGFHADLIAAGLSDAATSVADAHLGQLDLALSELTSEGRLEFLSEARRHASDMLREDVARRYRAEAVALLLANPDWHLGTPILDWFTAWGPAERELARALAAELPDRQLHDAIYLPFRDERRILSLRLDAADGTVLPGDAIEQVWQRPYAERRRGVDDAADLVDAIVRDFHGVGQTVAATDLLVTYQPLLLDSFGVRLVELWSDLGDCARTRAAVRLAVHEDSQPAHAALTLARGDNTAVWDEMVNVDAHAGVEVVMARHQAGGWRPRMGAALLRACANPYAAAQALDIQSSVREYRGGRDLGLETNWLSLWATIKADGGRRLVEAAMWQRHPYPGEVWSLFPDEDALRLIIADEQHDDPEHLEIMALLVRGMPDADRDVWAPIYRAIIWTHGDTSLSLAATLPE